MPFIRTVTGDIDPGELGVCYAHEHVLGAPPFPGLDPDFTMDSEEAAIRELNWFREAGGNALVEMSPGDYQRNAAGLARVSRATGIKIICATGHHKEKFSAAWIQKQSIDEMTLRFIGEINDGIDDTEIRAGVIKAGSSLDCITANERKVFEAAAAAHLATGAPISTHTEAGTMAIEQLKLLAHHGVAPTRIIIGHIDRNLDYDYHLQLLGAGAYISYDQISKVKYYPDKKRIEFILRLVDAGYGRQILIAGDLARKSYWPAYHTGGGPGLTYILWRFIPWLRSEGLEEQAIDNLLVHNPARAFSFSVNGH